MSDWALHLLAWGLTIICFLIGLVGTVLPGIPGQVVIALGVFLHWLVLRDAANLGWISLIGIPILWVIAQAVEWFASATGVKAKGGSKLAMLGAFIGSFVGLILGSVFIPIPVIGSLIGLVLVAGIGAFAAELLIHKKTLVDARGIGISASTGALTGLVVGFLLGCLMVGVFFVDRIF